MKKFLFVLFVMSFFITQAGCEPTKEPEQENISSKFPFGNPFNPQFPMYFAKPPPDKINLTHSVYHKVPDNNKQYKPYYPESYLRKYNPYN